MIKLYPFYAVVLLLLFHSIVVEHSPKVIAGTGRQGYSGDGGAASLALLHHPWGLAVDAADNIYIADYVNSRIRKVRAEDQTVVTIAGTGVNGYNGDSMDVRSAQLNTPMGVAVDSEGNVYIADDGNYRIRRIDAATGRITTVAGTGVRGFSGDGGPATRACLGDPWHLSLDADGNLYIADYSNNRIRKVEAASGTITTVAGNGVRGYNGDHRPATEAALNLPVATALDAEGNLYIADFNNHRIRKVDAGGRITTMAGGHPQADSGNAAVRTPLAYPGGVAVDERGNLYIADSDNRRILKVEAGSGQISPIAGGTASELKDPQALVLASGHLYVSDTYNAVVRMLPNVYEELPLNFRAFSAREDDHQVALQWQLSKTGPFHFSVQHSTDQVHWNTLKITPAKDGSGANRYHHQVSTPADTLTYYRLMAIGKKDTALSGIQAIRHTPKIEPPGQEPAPQPALPFLSIYPNPVRQNRFTLDIGRPPGPADHFYLTSLSGVILQRGNLQAQRQQIKTNDLTPGIYLIRLSDGRTTKMYKP